MGLQSSGAISLDDLHVEVGGTSGTTCSLNDADIRALIAVGSSTGQSLQQYYGQASETSLPTGGSQINGQVQLKEITASSYISSGETLRIPSNMWVWSDNTSVAALTIDIACTVVNDGKVIGKGGNGGSPYGGSGAPGGPAINVTASGVTITNSSGAYIAGGGGGGGCFQDYSNPGDAHSGGGGGAGGGNGGTGRVNNFYWQAGIGGALNASGANGGNGYASAGPGGGAGGGGGGSRYGGGGGGRILPGVGGGGGSNPGNGGSAGNAGNSGGPYVYSVAGGGCGWGAAGGLGGGRFGGGAGGAAIQGISRTLNNSGTIYGST